MAILHKKEEMDGYDINEEVIKYIANNIKSNIRELEGAINKVMAFAKLEQQEVNLELGRTGTEGHHISRRKESDHTRIYYINGCRTL